MLAAIFAGSADAIFTTTLDSTITSWNARAEELYGLAASEVIGGSVLVLYPPGQTDEEERILARVRNGEDIRELDAVRVRGTASACPSG